jgi:apolipoprotein D and lipocalin family protein
MFPLVHDSEAFKRAAQNFDVTEVKPVRSRQRPKTTLHGLGKLYILALLAAGTGGLLLGCTSQAATGNRRVPQPSRQVDLKLYLGTWYELARYDNRFEDGCEAVIAEYGLLPGEKISIRNSCHLGSSTGPLKIATGKAKVVPNSGNAKLKVSFFGPFYFGNYWVLDHAEDYSWSIVGEPSGRYLWILIRDPHPDEARRESLYMRAAELGYDTTRLRPTQQ